MFINGFQVTNTSIMNNELRNLTKRVSYENSFRKNAGRKVTPYLAGTILGVSSLFYGCSKDSSIPDPTPENFPPVASISADKYSGEAPLKSTIKISGTDINGSGDIKNYYLKINDLGVNISENKKIDTTLTFTKAGKYEVLGIVQDISGERDTAKVNIHVTQPDEPSVVQSLKLENDVIIKYEANSARLNSFELEVYKDSKRILSKIISDNNHSEIFDYTKNKDITKGNYEFVSKFKTNSGKDTSVVSTIEIPNYQPTVNWSSLDINFDEDGETKVILPNPSDKNPEDMPVNYIQNSFTSNKAELAFAQNNELTIKGVEDQFGDYSLSADFGTDEGGISSVQKQGEIYELLRLKGQIQNNETDEGMKSTLIPYEVIGQDTIKLYSKSADSDGRNMTDESGNFELKLNKKSSDLENILLMARKGIPGNYGGWVRVQNIENKDFKNILLRALPYAPYEDRKDEFKNFVLETCIGSETKYPGTVFDFDGSILRGNADGFEDYTGLKRIRILDKDPFTGGTFTKAEQEKFKSQILDPNDISSITGEYQIKPEQIVFGNDPNFEDYTLGNIEDGTSNILPSNGVVVVVPRKDLNAAGQSNVKLDTRPINFAGSIYINPENYQARTFSHEMEHIFLIGAHPTSLFGESLMSKYAISGVTKPGPADKKLSKISYEKTYLFQPDFKTYKMVDSVENILRDDFK